MNSALTLDELSPSESQVALAASTLCSALRGFFCDLFVPTDSDKNVGRAIRTSLESRLSQTQPKTPQNFRKGNFSGMSLRSIWSLSW